MNRIAASLVCFLLCSTATAAHGAWECVLDISTATTCRDAEGIAYAQASGTLLAVKGNTLFQFGAADRPTRVVQLDKQVVPDFNGIEALPTGNLLLVSARPRRLYEITPDGHAIATRELGDRVEPRGVAYCRQRKRIYVLDGADETVKQYSPADELEAIYRLRLSDACALEVPQPGVLWVLDGQQRKVFTYRAGEALTELVDLAQICDYEGPSGLALDRARGVLYICFAKSQRIVGVVVSGRGNPERAEPQTYVQAPSATDQPYRVVQLPPPSSARPPVHSDPQAGATTEVLPALEGDTDGANGPAREIQVVSPYPGSTIIVKPPSPPTIYVLPLIVRGNPVHPGGPSGPVGPASPGWHGAASPTCPPDLTVSDLEVISVTGRRITYRYLVTNVSSVPARLDGVIVHALASADHLRNPGDKLVDDHVFYGEILGPRQSRCVTDSGVLRQGFGGRPFLIVRLDTADRLAESNEENNSTVTLTTFAK